MRFPPCYRWEYWVLQRRMYRERLTPWDRESEETPAFLSPWSRILSLSVPSWADASSGLEMGVWGAQLPQLPSSTSPSLTQLNSDSHHLSRSKICQEADRQVLAVLAAHRSWSRHYIPLNWDAFVFPLSAGEQPDLLFFYCNWVSLVGLPSSQLSKEIIQKCTAASTTVQVPAEAEAGGNFQMHSLITLSTPRWGCWLHWPPSSCNHFCSSQSSAVSPSAAVPSGEPGHGLSKGGGWDRAPEACEGLSPSWDGDTLNSNF